MPAEKKKNIVVVGSINMDLVAYAATIPSAGQTITGTGFKTFPGGKGANQAVAVARLGCPVKLIGRIGNDAFGHELHQHLQDAGVDVSAVQTSACSSGVAVILVSERGENCIVITPGANALLTPQDLDANVEILRNASLVLTQLEIPIDTVEHLASICERENVPLILDPAPARDLPATLLKKIAWFTPNETEAAFYLGKEENPKSSADALLKMGPRGVILKLGNRGAYLNSEAGNRHFIEAFRVDAVDSTAAGDVFNGAFAAALLDRGDAVTSARFAAAAAALSVMKEGAQPSMPSLTEVQGFLKESENQQ